MTSSPLLIVLLDITRSGWMKETQRKRTSLHHEEAELCDAGWVYSRYDQLALIDGKRKNALCHGQLYQNRIARAFNKKDEGKGKFSPNRQGPYMVHRVLAGGALILAEIDGEIWPKPINLDAIKRYYV
ncbi:uncharacterized protein [Nicotiana tomentosiformis]|uniref:uncharacterized protein n=1 Tax=Nicotiana tomentosiformis TaxID=4098 RepID=UPI00388C65BE